MKEFLKEKAYEVRRTVEKAPLKPSDVEFYPEEIKEYMKNLRECANLLEPPPMLKAWENKILKMVPKKLKTKFPKTVNEILNESKDTWNKSLHDLAVKSKIRDVPGEERIRYQEKPFKYGGKTPNYEAFLKTRKNLTQKLYTVHPFICYIQESSAKMFPQHLLNFEIYRGRGIIEMDVLKQSIDEDLLEAESILTTIWYPYIVTWLKVPRCLNDVPLKKRMHLLNCASVSIAMKITELMRASIDYLIDIIGESQRTPQIIMELDFDKDLILIPSFLDISAMYHSVIDAIASVTQELLPLERWLDLPTNYDYLPIKLNDWSLEDSHNRLQISLDRVFQPVKEYMENIKVVYSVLFRDFDAENVIIGCGEEFDESCERIKDFQDMFDELSAAMANEYFDVGRVNQDKMIEGLKASTVKCQDEILHLMCLAHMKENMSICAGFEDIAAKALVIPTTAAELIESGLYCLHAKTVLIIELTERITESLVILSKLIELTELTPEHVELNNRTINWLKAIKPILDKNASSFETCKFEMEENLIAKTAQLNKRLLELMPYLLLLDDMDDINNTLFYLEDIRRMIHWLDDCDRKMEWINHEESVFGFPISQYPDLDELKGYIIPFYELIYLLHKWRRSYYTWMDGVFEYIDNALVEEQHEEYYKEFLKLSKNFKVKIKQQIAENNERRFKGFVEDPDPMNLPAPMKLCAQALKELKEWRPNVQVVNIMCNSALRQRHWDEMSEIAGFDLTPDAGTTIRKIIALDLWDDMEQYEIISMGACKELALITGLEKMQSEWVNVNFKTNPYKDTGIQILTALDDIQAILDDHIVKTIGMRGSAFVKPFETEVKAWYEKLNRINSSIDEWGKVQSQWLYLLPIFSSKDIIAQMPEEGIMFQEVDGTYRRYMAIVAKNPKVLETAGGFGLLEGMRTANGLLEKINEGVNNYLEKKRLYFPRFFFLSNDEILEILSETKNPLRVQPHLKKCFEGINKLEFDPDLNILAMISKEEEHVELCEQISTAAARGSVEKWLVQVEEQMIRAIRTETELSYSEYPTISREEWITIWEGMVVLCVSQIYWAQDIHSCLKTHKLNELIKFSATLLKQLNSIVTLVRSPKLTNLARISIKALIVIDVHAKDVVQELVDKEVIEETDFNWLAQLRYYWENEDVAVKIINAVVRFAYEYLGNSDRLVITPLTDRCYRTLIGAYYLHLNGAPEGPAGTGKTETTKDLAKALAVQCVVFNCSDGLDYKAMGKFFKGLASSGAWACFDEFNRIEVDVLSVVAQQILCIVQAVRQHAETFLFEGTVLRLNPACYVCITMNPGYAGRSELPDNLKVLFRTVAMMVPDYAMIGEISLYSYGFIDARNLAVKIVTTYRLCSEQLSSQNHYDYGMRAVKTVLSACGNIKKKFPDENEGLLLLRCLTDVNLPKFLSFDVPLFQGIISDIFPGVSLPDPDYEKLIDSSEQVCKNLNLVPTESFLLKIIQTFEMLIVRHGFMLVGDPFSGKTCTLQTLADAFYLFSDHKFCTLYRVINPKAVTIGQLYGAFDPVSYEWTDGVVATTFREYATMDDNNKKWIIFDGPVDAVWIENMNTVLDDNKKLCLTSGEVIAMSDTMSMIFEVMDLSQASPATVSRCGMIYMESATLGPMPFVKSWINKCNPYWKDDNELLLHDVCEWLLPPTLTFVRKFCQQMVSGGEINLVMTTLRLIEMLMDDAIEGEEDSRYIKTWLQASFIFSVCWGIGGLLTTDSKEKFEEYYKEFWRGEIPIPESMEKIDVSIPTEGTFYDYVYQYKQKGCWKPWSEILKNAKLIETINLQQTVIPTLDTAKYLFLLDLHVRYKKPWLIIGPTGTGKSFYIQNYMMTQLSLNHYMPIFITFTTTTSANQTQDLVITKLLKRKNNIYGPPKGSLAVIFVDDMNMPAKEVYGAQPAIEILRQYFDHKHWYNLKTTEKILILDVLLVAAIGPVGGSKQLIYARLLRHYSMVAINEFSDETMTRIFTNVLQIAMRRNGFGNDAMPSIMAIVAATMDMYQSAMRDLRPTPAKSHYIFNLRDYARVIQGCSLIKKDSVDNKKVFIKLWVHEILRVFYDRLTDDEDRAWLFKKLQKLTRDYFKEFFDAALDNYLNDQGVVTEETLRGLMFGTYFDPDALDDEKKYEEIPSIEAFHKKGIDSLEEYNSMSKTKMNIVLFQYALEHLSKICRIFSMPGGSALLVGVGGSGRQSLARLASSMTGKILFQPEITKSYGLRDWREDIKKVLRQSGGLGKETSFLFTEGQIQEETFIQNIDSLLNSGEIPNLYELDEKQEILELVRLAAQGGNRNLDVSALEVFAFFIARCKAKLHIALCFSPIGSSFRNRLRLYPSLVNCCTIDWFESWPEDALEKVANHYMNEVNLSDQVKTSSVVACKYFHVDARRISDEFFALFSKKTYVTSASYLDLIKSFTKLTNKKQKELRAAKQRYVNGLDKLNSAAEAVAVMQRDLNALKPQLIIMAAKGAEMMAEIEKETIEADKATVQVREDTKVANLQAADAQVLKKDCEADLALAIPILEDAIAALNTLKPADITLVKSMKNPPAAVKLVMAAVCVMKNIPPDKIPDPDNPGKKMFDFWGPSKKLLGDMAFLPNLKEFDKDNIPVATMVKIRKEYLPHKDFKPHIIAKASTAAEGLCKWVIAMDMYDAVAKVVAPKKAKLQAAEDEFAATMAILDEKKAMVARLEQKVADLNLALEEANAKKQMLEDEVELCINKLYRAEKLIGGLGGEKHRWTAAAENLQVLYDNLAGDILLSCGIIAYLAPFTMPFRIATISDWKHITKKLNIPFSEDYVFAKVLGTDIKIQNWYIAGLPRDQISTDNAIIQDTSIRWSLLVDPQGQANKWIKRMEKANDLSVTKLTDPNYMKILEPSLEYGMPALIENILEDLEAPLDPILMKNTYIQGGKAYIALGENVIEYSPKFRLYMTTKLRNPHYLPEVFNKVTLINFALTVDGLEDQLLGIVVAKERPDLQEKREKLIVESAENNTALKNVEDSILRTLQESKGDILEDEGAIEILDSSKILSDDILIRQEATKETEAMIEEFRLQYRPIATHSAVIYYCVTDLPNVDPMYQYSLVWFINLYVLSIETANKSKILEKRLKFLRDAFTYNLYCNVCRSLFEKDKLMFSFLLCSKIMLATHAIDHAEFNFLLTGGISVDNPFPNPTTWLSAKSWDEICCSSELPAFKKFRESFTETIKIWQKIYDSINPHTEKLPNPWNDLLTDFQKLIIIRCLRPDKLIEAITSFVEKELGTEFVSPPPFDIKKSYNDSNCLVPLIFILSPGADPMGALWKFCERMGYDNKFYSISLGQGQGPIAQAMIEQAQIEGGWVCLQNCHLAAKWLPVLEMICEKFDLTNTDLNFRLWLTSYPSADFPQSVLQVGVKMTNEPPTGLQNNLRRSYLSEPLKEQEFYEGCPGKEKTFTKLLYGVCFFHAVVQERRKFGPLGWNIPYGFNESDFQISVMQLQMFLNQYEETPYTAISYLTGECNYGGRVTDDWDRRLIVTVLKNYVNADMIQNATYTFCAISPQYGLPRRCEYQDYLKHIDAIPAITPPEVLGLHMNAGISRDYSDSMALTGTLLQVQGGSGGGSSGGSSDILLSHLCSDILAKLAPPFDLEVAKEKFPVSYTESMNTVLVQEMERFNKLGAEIRSSLVNLQKAIKGLIVMSPQLETQANAMLITKIPVNWTKVSYPSLKPLASYVLDFVERVRILQSWFDYGKPAAFWLSGFFFTQAFLTGGMQNYARWKRIPIDTLIFDCEVLKPKAKVEGSRECIYVYGPFIDGARWNVQAHIVDEQLPKILNEPIPYLKFFPVKKADFTEGTKYRCPLYKTIERRGILATTGHSSNFVLSLMLPSAEPPSHWVKRSAALILQLSD